MARKFNIGRQGEQLLNEEWHGLFMALKYLNFDRYKGMENVYPERQTEIPDHALRIKSRENLDLLQVFYPTIGEGTWKNLFEGYYHPASAVRPDSDVNLVPYQLCIDPKTGAIMYWDSTSNSWVVARANEYIGELNSFSGVNFQFITPLTQLGSSYPVPYVPYGKLFSGTEYVSVYVRANDCAILPPANANPADLSWVHINASKLIKVDKRLLLIQNDRTKIDYGFIGITSTQTEFYGFKQGHRLGYLLKRNQDFKDVVGGIQLINPGSYKYIYSITYSFDESPSNEGLLLSKTTTIGGKNEVYIGQVNENISLFMDGLSLEQKDEKDNDIYVHNKVEGTITFTDDDDAEIINNMQMTTLLFPKRSAEFTISSAAANVTATADTVTVEVGNNLEGWITPMVFCSGLGLQETEIFEDVIIDKGKVTIKNFVLPGDEVIKGYVADVGNSFICKGVLNTPTIIHDKIDSGKEYTVFVNGILLTPTNGDISVEDNKITINNADDVKFDNLDYVVFEIDDSSEDKIALVFDETVSYYSIRIDDGGAAATYNDCNSAIVYLHGDVGDLKGGILLDQAAIERPLNSIEGYYKGGQILRLVDDYGNYRYYIYDYTEEEPVALSAAEISEVESMIGYYATSGSIHLLGNDKSWDGLSLSYYAYNYANMIDEIAIPGSRNDLPIYVKKDASNNTYLGSAGRLEAWKAGCASLSTYINGLIIDNKEEEISEGMTRRYSLTYPNLTLNYDKKYYGERDLLAALNALYNKYKSKINEYKSREEYKDVPDTRIIESILLEEDISMWEINKNEIANDYFHSKQLSREALQLAIYFNEDMQEEHSSYVIEKIERGEFLAANRDYIYLETGKDNNHGQVYGATQDTIEADFLLAPGTINVYLNGVLLTYEDYIKFDNNKIMFNIDVCGVQQLPLPSKMAECLPDYLDAEELFTYQQDLKKKQVIRLIEDKPYYIPTSNRDTILVEKRGDTSIKSVTYDVLVSSYNSFEFTQDYYDIPDSLANTVDLVKIYINGVYYDGGYIITKTGGIKGIRLLDENALTMDPLYEHFSRYPEKAEEYLQMYGKRYERAIDKITFEWR